MSHPSIADGNENMHNHSGRKLDVVLTKDLPMPLLGIYPEDVLPYHKDTCSTMLRTA